MRSSKMVRVKKQVMNLRDMLPALLKLTTGNLLVFVVYYFLLFRRSTFHALLNKTYLSQVRNAIEAVYWLATF